jgi:hypothetical protein
MDDGILGALMALRAFSRGPYHFAPGLAGFSLRPGAVDQERRDDEAKSNHNRYKY